MLPEEIPLLSVVELANYIEKKEITPLETVRAYLSRIEKFDPKLNSYITVLADEAEQAAEIAVQTVRQFILKYPHLDEVIFCCFNTKVFNVYRKDDH